jgi:hypothetical protein
MFTHKFGTTFVFCFVVVQNYLNLSVNLNLCFMLTFSQPSFIKSSVLFLIVLLTLLLTGCSGYQTVSYYGDGIYDDEVVQQQRQVTTPVNNGVQQNSGTYYKSYFADKAAQGIQDDYMFTDIEQYQDASPQSSGGNYQAHGSWGDQADRININVIYNRPFGWNWYYAPFNYGRSSFWGYNYHPWYFTFNHDPFFNPYGWGFRNPYYRSYWNNWRYRNPYYRPGLDRVYYTPVRYSRLNGSREFSRTKLTNRTTSGANNRAAVSNNNSQQRTNTRGTTTVRRVSGNNNRQYYSDSDNNSDTSQNRNTSRRYSHERSTSNNSSYRSSSSSSTSSYRRSTPSSSTRSTSSSSSRSSSGSSRRR